MNARIPAQYTGPTSNPWADYERWADRADYEDEVLQARQAQARSVVLAGLATEEWRELKEIGGGGKRKGPRAVAAGLWEEKAGALRHAWGRKRGREEKPLARLEVAMVAGADPGTEVSAVFHGSRKARRYRPRKAVTPVVSIPRASACAFTITDRGRR